MKYWALVILLAMLGCSASLSLEPPLLLSNGSYLVKNGTSIQYAIDYLGSSDATLVVEDGVYPECLQLKSKIRLKSQNLLGSTIKTTDNSKESITGWGVTDIEIDGFHIFGGIQIGQEGSDFSKAVSNIRIMNNRIEGAGGKDGIKINAGIGLLVSNNEVFNVGVEQGIDFVGVKDYLIYGNTVHDIYGSAGMGIVTKAGSKNGMINSNHIYNCNNAAIACGQVSDETWIWLEGLTYQYEASNIIVSNNYFHHNSKLSILSLAAIDCIFVSNRIETYDYYAYLKVASSDMTHNPAWVSKNVAVLQAGLTADKIDVGSNQIAITLNGNTIP